MVEKAVPTISICLLFVCLFVCCVSCFEFQKKRELEEKRFSEWGEKAVPTISDMEPCAGLDITNRLGLQISPPPRYKYPEKLQTFHCVCSFPLRIYSPWKQSDKNTTSQPNSEVTTHRDRGGG